MEELRKTIIANYRDVVTELGNEAVAIGATEVSTISPDLMKVVADRCDLTPGESDQLVRHSAPNDEVLYAVNLVIMAYELDRAARFQGDVLAALLDEQVSSDPKRLWHLVKAALDRRDHTNLQ